MVTGIGTDREASASPIIGYGCYDADNHYYEARDAFTRYIEPDYASLAINVRVDDNGEDRTYIGGEPFTFLAPLFSKVQKPGSLREVYRNPNRATFDEARSEEYLLEEYVSREARLALMDRQGLDAVIMLPTLGVTVEHQMRHNVVQTFANLRAFNRWLESDWGYRGRIYGVPLLSLLDCGLAIQELERVINRNARFIHIRPAPVNNCSPFDPKFDPFWARVNEAGLRVIFHISESGYNELFSVHWGEQANCPSHRMTAFQGACFFGDRPIMDTLASLIYSNLPSAFPNIRFLSIENGSGWVRYLLKQMDKHRGTARFATWPRGRPQDRPSDIFREYVYVAPHHEEDLVDLVDVLGEDRVLFGSDYPHPEGLAHPVEFAEGLRGLPEQAIRKVMRENLRNLLG